MTRPVEEPTVDESGDESHPAFGLIGAYRTTSTPGAILFDSDIQHHHTVRVRVKAASRRRDLNHDWIHGRDEFVEVEMSEAQWASFVSSMNSGDGVPCTVLRREKDWEIPGLPYAPRLARSLDETRGAAQKAFGEIQDALDAYEKVLADKGAAADRREALSWLRSRINNAVPNVDYAGRTLVEHAEDVVTRARADVEAFVVHKAHQLGLDPADVAGQSLLALGPESPQEDAPDEGKLIP